VAYLLIFILSGVFWAASCNNLPTSLGAGEGTIIIVKGHFHYGPFAAGQSVEHSFDRAGTYGYYCSAHRTNTASVLVDSDGADSVVVQIAASAFTPAVAHIKSGGYVRWVNSSTATNHTVISD
jgi:plastocyanin